MRKLIAFEYRDNLYGMIWQSAGKIHFVLLSTPKTHYVWVPARKIHWIRVSADNIHWVEYWEFIRFEYLPNKQFIGFEYWLAKHILYGHRFENSLGASISWENLLRLRIGWKHLFSLSIIWENLKCFSISRENLTERSLLFDFNISYCDFE